MRDGSGEAVDRILARYLPPLRRWAHGRLPVWARDLLDTDDVVQDAVLKTVQNLAEFEMRHGGALQAYLRQAVLNRIQDEVRRIRAAPRKGPLAPGVADRAPSPLEEAVGAELLERYETAMRRLAPEDREAIVARVELGGTYAEIAAALGKPSPDAARMAVSRAVLRLAREMGHGG